MEAVGGGDESGRHEVLHQLQERNQHHPGELGGRSGRRDDHGTATAECQTLSELSQFTHTHN